MTCFWTAIWLNRVKPSQHRFGKMDVDWDYPWCDVSSLVCNSAAIYVAEHILPILNGCCSFNASWIYTASVLCKCTEHGNGEAIDEALRYSALYIDNIIRTCSWFNLNTICFLQCSSVWVLLAISGLRSRNDERTSVFSIAWMLADNRVIV